MKYISDKYNIDDLKYYLGKQFVSAKKPIVDIKHDAYIVPSGFDLPEGVSVDYNGVTPCERCDEDVVYFGNIYTAHFGNILYDYVSRLWWQVENAKPQKWVFIKPQRVTVPTLLYQIAEWMGIKREMLVEVTTPTRFKSVIVPEEAFIHDGYIMPAYASIFNRMYEAMQQKDIPTYDKIYLTRRSLKRKKEIGEWRFEKFFAANGYQVIAPEKLRLEEQAYLLRHCKSIASLEGSHAHGVVWSEYGTGGGQIVLRKQSEVIPRQIMFNRLWQRELVFVDVFEEPFKGFPISHDRGPFLLRWTKEMEQYAKDNGMIVPASCRYGYWKDWIVYAFKCVLYKAWHMYKHRKD